MIEENNVELLSKIVINELNKLENVDCFKNYDVWVKNIVDKYKNENIPLKEDTMLYLITMYNVISKLSIRAILEYLNESSVTALKEIGAESYANLFESSKDKLNEILKDNKQISKDSSKKIVKIVIEFVIKLVNLFKQDGLAENYLIKYIENNK